MSTALSRAIGRHRRFQPVEFNGEWVIMFTQHYGLTKRTKPNAYRSGRLYNRIVELFFSEMPEPQKIVLHLSHELTVNLPKQRGYRIEAIEYKPQTDEA